jgi:hypothetical protein
MQLKRIKFQWKSFERNEVSVGMFTFMRYKCNVKCNWMCKVFDVLSKWGVKRVIKCYWKHTICLKSVEKLL